MKNDSTEILGCSRLPSQLVCTRRRVLWLLGAVFVSLFALWLLVDDSGREFSATRKASANIDSYTSGFFSGFVFAFTMFVALAGILEALKVYLGIGLSTNEAAERRWLD